MMDRKDFVSIDDLSTLAAREKEALVKYCKAAFADDAILKLNVSKKSIMLAQEEKVTYKLVAEQEEKRAVKTVEEAVNELGLSNEAGKKIIKGYKSREIKKYHINDIKYLSDLLQMLHPAQQKKAVDIIVQNRKELYHINKEDVVLLLVTENRISPYFAEVWYNGFIRALEKMNRKITVEGDLLSAVDPIYHKDLKRKLKTAADKLDNFKNKL